MDIQFSYDLIPMLLAALVSFMLSILVLRRRSTTWSRTYSFLMLMVGIWCLGYSGELAFVTVYWTYFLSIGIVSVPVLWFMFIVQYTGREKWLNPFRIALLFVLPLINLILVWSSSTVHLYYTYIAPGLIGNFRIIDVHYGPMFWTQITYAYLLILITTLIIFVTLFRSFQSYRDQFATLLLASLIPILGNAIYLLGLSPHVDLTPLSFALSGIIFLWSIFRYQFLEIIPIARETVVERMSDGMIVLDMEYRVVDLNPAAEKITGRNENQALGNQISLVLPDHPELIKYLSGEGETHAEMRFNTEKPFYYDLHMSPLRNKHGDQSGRLIIMTDITERKKAEQEKEKMIAEIQEANDQLKKVDKAKDEFLSIVTHDLKTPLTVILGYAGVMLSGMSGQITPQQRGMMETIKKQANSQQEMIDTILDYTRMEFGRIVVNAEKFSISTMVKEFSEAERVEADKKQIRVNITLPTEEMMMEADKRMIGRVINNLIGNAIKYTPEGGNINVELQVQDQIVRLIVADSGIGIAPEHLDKVFEKFFVVDPAGARERRSLGLGLSIVKSFVEAHHGKIWVESEGLGRGSKFIVELPIEFKE